jgi:hypothetical protein
MGPIEILSILSSLSTIVKNLKETFRKKKDRKPKIDVENVLAESERVESYAKRSPKSQEAIAQISDAYLEPLEKRINRSRNKIKKQLDNPNSTHDLIMRVVEKSEKDICWSLQMIKKFNGGLLPTKKFQNLWREHGCKEGAQRKTRSQK